MHSSRQIVEREGLQPVVRRRDWLKGAAAVAVGAAAAPVLASHLRTRARKLWRLGIAGNVYGRLPLEEAAKRIKADGFRSILATFQFADAKFNPLEPDWSAAEKILATLEKHDIAVGSLYGYYNVIDPDAARREKGEARMEFLIRNWKRLGCNLVSTETGTRNPKSPWLGSPENDTEEAYVECRKSLERWARLAEKTGAVVTLEVSAMNVIGTIDRAERVLREVNSPALKLVMDPTNYFRAEDLPRMKEMLKQMFERLGPQIVIAHAKDVKGTDTGMEHPAAGLGALDYPLYLRLLAELNRPLDLILEHVKLDDVARARDVVLGHIEKLP